VPAGAPPLCFQEGAPQSLIAVHPPLGRRQNRRPTPVVPSRGAVSRARRLEVEGMMRSSGWRLAGG